MLFSHIRTLYLQSDPNLPKKALSQDRGPDISKHQCKFAYAQRHANDSSHQTHTCGGSAFE